ncbi:MAG: oxygen-independent coproporphyrinogen III oxidase-like protein [Brachymonas sp.]|jgi:oxygen-independent coproporphyrinogen-3 oxidase|nr:oxygen-independent coproporphyrinogen III oxidase-like protein [Brachymonas sp.]MBP8821224.1 oxygen-independent coproporphyrinogen III oxidase-like protein [Brachymonas sp.]
MTVAMERGAGGQRVATVGHYLRPGLLQLQALPPLAFYIHLPWCLQKCPYCDFNSHGLQGATGVPPEKEYLCALLADLEAALPLIWGRPVYSIFFGGGTPSLFSPDAIAELLAAVRARLPLLPTCEITLEANPGTFEQQRFAAFAQAGVTRLSVGVQSFDDAALRVIGRVHNAAQARAALEEAARCFRTFNLDLMYALPGQTLGMLQADLAQALAFAPPHLSIYHLTIEPNTAFAVRPPRNLPDDDLAYDMLDAITRATHHTGLERYEVSAYARPGHACVHNRNYWEYGDYLGIGAGAHSKLSFPHRIVRQVRLRDPRRYMQQALVGQALAQEHDVPHADLAFEYMLNALRLRQGFALADFTARTGLAAGSIEPALRHAEEKGWIERDLHCVRPTVRGFDFLSDLQALFLPAHA